MQTVKPQVGHSPQTQQPTETQGDMSTDQVNPPHFPDAANIGIGARPRYQTDNLVHRTLEQLVAAVEGIQQQAQDVHDLINTTYEQVTLQPNGEYDPFANYLNILPFITPDFPEYSSLVNRLATFTQSSWPADSHVTSTALAENGFFCTGHRDVVICFHCGTVLAQWKEGDVVAFEHATYSPYCGFLSRLVGPNYIRHVQNQLHSVNEVPEHFKNIIKPHGQSDSLKPKQTSRPVCKICFERPIDLVALPCCHMTACTQCLSTQKNCGVCRQLIKYVLRVLF
ncbi:baculoviral IAP repeat-containing protein 7-A-like [Thrips palmi]|uniref:Baculoviral IAP repeat-containing protein 7-A-like n=1 Tax=Thrips palmi TaxID=161013 RepID=A0A6P8YVP2_THRPL|nr:baculoviral IAP repeat-containing protein 7-A-like [Thrips palmi]